MRFSDIAGHKDTIDGLRAMADSGRIPHALLLAGPAGIGKMNLARTFAQYIHCSDRRDGEPCGRCPSCLQHRSLNNPDVHYVYPVVKRSSPRRDVSTDYFEEWKRMLEENPFMPLEKWMDIIEAGNTRPAIYVTESDAIAATASLSSYKERFKIFIVWLPERMRPEAANKLLKLIEEPFPDTLFIMVSDNSQELLPTILSRTRRLNLSPLSENETAGWLSAGFGLSEDKCLEIARLSEGNLTVASEMATHAGERKEFGEMFRMLMRGAYARKLADLRRLSESLAAMGREKLSRFLAYSSSMVRENYIYNLGIPPLTLMTQEELEFSSRFSAFIHSENVEEMAAEFTRARNDIMRNANARIVLFDLSLWLCLFIRRPRKT